MTKNKDKKCKKRHEMENENNQLTEDDVVILKKMIGFCKKFLSSESTENREPQIIEKIVEKEVIVEKKLIDPIRENMKVELELLNIIQQDNELQKNWLLNSENEGQQLVKINALLSQWQQIEMLWDMLANRCKEHKRGLSENETRLLNGALSIYNITLNQHKAELRSIEVNTPYNYEKHQRGIATGDRVIAQWLPTLVNAAGEVTRLALVETN
jgi:hypothetical protein